MPDPSYKKSDSDENSEVSWEFFDEEVEEFHQPEIEDTLEFVEVEETGDLSPENQEEVSPQRRRARANKNAKAFVNMGASGFASFAAVYARADNSEFLIDPEDQRTIAEPLSDVLYENKSLDLPPGWALVLAILIAFVPMTIKAIQMRREYKALEESKKESIELVKKKKDEKDEKEEE